MELPDGFKKIDEADTGEEGFPPTFVFTEERRVLQGRLIEREEVLTQFGDRTAYRIKLSPQFCTENPEIAVDTDNMISVWGSSDLQRKLKNVPNGSELLIVYQGVRGRTKIYQVAFKPPVQGTL